MVEPEDDESPSTLTLLPPTFTGMVTTGDTWLPPAMLSSPDVDASDADATGAASAVDEPDDEESPTAETALPPIVTGTETTPVTWLPLAMPSFPEVDEVDEDGADAAAGAVFVAAASEPESPMTLTAFPPTVTGTDTTLSTSVPESTLPSPDVSAACAAVAPRRVIPPAKRTPYRHLAIVRFMVVLLEI